ncbi:MAG: tetratricopeptide repeat protein [Bdellovibrionales bacterium]|nr:tetratricopeptide repeat protein [Bdellovibrionales bacterium]
MWLRIFTFSTIAISSLSWAQEEAKKQTIQLKNKGAIKIVYGSPQWNVDATQPDSAFLYVREGGTGKIAKIVLDETAPDSATFSGYFSLGWDDLEKTKPEVYIPPQNLRGQEGLEKFKKMLTSGKLSRKPVVFRTDEDGSRILDVFDTKDQAVRAWEAHKKALELRQQKDRAEDLLKKAQADEATIATAQMAEKQKVLKELELEATKREMDRIRLEQLEKQKAEELKAKQAQMNAAEKKRKQNEAKKIAAEALKFYKNGEYQKALPLFQQALELDPENTDYYLQYGITQYRLEQFNEALVTMKVAPNKPESLVEKSYYMGLIYFRLRELPQALEKFRYVKTSPDPQLGPSAAFYEGMILFGQEKWDESQTSFEQVLDTSEDPRMDEKAEEYIEKIANIKAWNKKKEKPFTLVAMVGAQYDSNVLLSPDGVASQGSTIEGDMRGVLMGQLQYRALYERSHEFVPTAMTYYQRSSKDSVSSADVFLNNIALPYTYKGTALGKGYKFTAKPAYELINMDVNEDGTREVVLNSIIANFDNTFVMNDRWIASYIFEARQDDSQLTTSTNDDDADAIRYTLKTKHINFLNEKKKKLLISNFAIVYNDANGKNKKYQRFELGATYMKPINWWESTWNLGLAIYQLNYPDASTARKDLNATLTTGITRPVYDWLNFGVTATYTNNNSDVSTNQYSKYTVMTNFTSNYSF